MNRPAKPDAASAPPAAVSLGAVMPWHRDALATALAQQRGHAILAHGAAGDGSFEFVMALARGWLCEAAAGAPRPCGQCAACQLFAGAAHPDMGWLVPEEMAVRRGMPVALDERRKPSRQIRVDDVRELIDWAGRTSGRGRGKAIVVFPGEAMNAVAASALLKTLEEPPVGTRIVIATADPARLLPTIVSRCQRLVLPSPSPSAARQWLQEQGVASPDVLLQACGGRPLDVVTMQAAGIDAAAWQALPARIARGDAAAVAGWGVPLAVDALAKLCHDAMACCTGAAPRFFPPAAFADAGMTMEHLGRLVAWQRSLATVMRAADHPWNEPLMADALVAEARDALNA